MLTVAETHQKHSKPVLREQLTPAELDLLEQAREVGYLIASGQRFQLWRRHREQCQQDGRPFITIRLGTRATSLVCDLNTCPSLPADIRRRLAAAAKSHAKHPNLEAAERAARELVQIVQADGAMTTLWGDTGARI